VLGNSTKRAVPSQTGCLPLPAAVRLDRCDAHPLTPPRARLARLPTQLWDRPLRLRATALLPCLPPNYGRPTGRPLSGRTGGVTARCLLHQGASRKFRRSRSRQAIDRSWSDKHHERHWGAHAGDVATRKAGASAAARKDQTERFCGERDRRYHA